MRLHRQCGLLRGQRQQSPGGGGGGTGGGIGGGTAGEAYNGGGVRRLSPTCNYTADTQLIDAPARPCNYFSMNATHALLGSLLESGNTQIGWGSVVNLGAV